MSMPGCKEGKKSVVGRLSKKKHNRVRIYNQPEVGINKRKQVSKKTKKAIKKKRKKYNGQEKKKERKLAFGPKIVFLVESVFFLFFFFNFLVFCKLHFYGPQNPSKFFFAKVLQEFRGRVL